MSNLYWIEDEHGRKVKFKPRWEQKELNNNLHDQTVVLKCRQPGISSWCAIDMLDFMLFCDHKTGGIIDKTDEDAKRKLDKIRFAYEHLDDPTGPNDGEDTSRIGAMLKASRRLSTDNVKELEWSNGSKIWAGTNMRGGTLQRLWITELGHISYYDPDRAEEIKKGALNTIHAGNLVTIESTFEGGKFGVYYSLLKLAMESKEPLTSMDWKFVFFPWWRHVNYILALTPAGLVLDHDEAQYFKQLEERGISLSPEQKHWYIKKKATIGDAMLSEFPSTPEEAFEAVIKGAIYGRNISQLRAAKRITDFEYDRISPLYTFWDLGFSDFTPIWLIQFVGRDIGALNYLCACREEPSYYVGKIREWESQYGQPVALHFLPHDAARKELSGRSYQDYLREAGISNVRIVPVSPDKWLGIHRLRALLPRFYFHKTNCSRTWKHGDREMPSGIGCLEGYHTKEDASSGVIRELPVHDENSHGADGLRVLAEAEMNGLIPKESTPPPSMHQKPKVILAGYNQAREDLMRRGMR